MIKTLLSSLFAVFLFAMGAVGAWYFVQFQEKQQQEADSADAVADGQVVNVSDLDASTTPTVGDPQSSNDGGPPMNAHLPAPVRNRSMSPEERFRFGVLYGDQIEDVKKRTERLQEQESRLHLVRKDLDQQKLEIEGVMQQVKTYVAQADNLLSQVKSEREALKAEKESQQKELEEIKNARSVPTDIEQKNVKKMAEMLGGMNEASSAQILKTLANEGKMNYALMLLDSIEQRDASKILDALGDPGLQAEFTEAYRQLPRAAETTRR